MWEKEKKVSKRNRDKHHLLKYKIASNEREDRDDITEVAQKY